MDIIFMIFAMSSIQPVFESPKQPQALTVEIIKVNVDRIDEYNDMWNPNWIEKREIK